VQWSICAAKILNRACLKWVILDAAGRGGIPIHVRSTSNSDHKFNVLASVAMGQSTKSLRDSPLRG
jgi:hypothetical protein